VKSGFNVSPAAVAGELVRYAPSAAAMSHDVDEWFADPAIGADWQDMDLVLADLELLPRLKSYLADPSAPEFKKVDVISALLELLEHDCPRDAGPESERLAEDLRSTIRQYAGASKSALRELGPVKEVVLRSILGLPIPPDYPQWIIDRAREEGA
jgi:hypothetical protein